MPYFPTILQSKDMSDNGNGSHREENKFTQMHDEPPILTHFEDITTDAIFPPLTYSV